MNKDLLNEKEIEFNNRINRNCLVINLLSKREENEKICNALNHLYLENELLYQCIYAIEYDRKHSSYIHGYFVNEYNKFKSQPIYKVLNEIDKKDEKVKKLS